MTKNKYFPFNNNTPLHKDKVRAKMSVKQKQSTISFTTNKADF